MLRPGGATAARMFVGTREVRSVQFAGAEAWRREAVFEYRSAEARTVMLSAGQVVGENLVVNPSFEVNMSGWGAARLTLSQDTTRGWVGSSSLKAVQSTGEAFNYGLTNYIVHPSPGTEPLVIRFHAYTETGATVRPWIWAYNVQGGTTVGSNESLTGGYVALEPGVWTEVEMVHTGLTAATNQVRASFGLGVNETVWVDGFMLARQSLDPGFYFDSSTTNRPPA